MEWRILPKGKHAWIRLGLLAGIPALTFTVGGWWCIAMPGTSFRGRLPEPTAEQNALATRLEERVTHLATTIGPRGVFAPERLATTADWIEGTWRAQGLDPVRESWDCGGVEVANLVATLPGGDRPDEILVIGAHYDTDAATPGADDNASGVAALLEISGALADTTPARTLRFVAFVNEEPPFFQREGMGSLRYARGCRERGENVVGMLSLETLGYYDTAEGSQWYPRPFSFFYPSTGDFLLFVGNTGSRELVHDCVRTFREHARFPSEGAALPSGIPGVGLSDHWSFWQCGYPAVMVTDTAPFRNERYHTGGDKADTLDYGRFARAVEGVVEVVRTLAE